MCETRPRSNRRRARVLPATLAAWRWYRPDGTRRPMPYCALRTTATCTVSHPVWPSPQTNPLGLLGPSRSSAARTLPAGPVPFLVSLAPLLAARLARRWDGGGPLHAVASRRGVLYAAASAAPAGRLPA